ncbi:MAG: pseudaminic acid cytidylyltransferase [Deltaproteobacteria bacterium]|nr:pseudaminic acid cytidylyltransferase [Deltaproteobacteria bacterium]
MRLAVIPARGGSKRIPGKNIIPFCGRPMISYPISAAKASGLFHKIHVSTDSDEIRQTVETLGLPVDFMRDPALADDYTGLLPVLRWVVDEYQQRGEIYNEVCCIMPAAPLLQSKDLNAAFELFHNHKSKYPLLVMTRYPVPIEWAFRRDKDGFMTAVSSSQLNCRSQDLPDTYYESGPFTIWSTSQLIAENPLSGKILSYVMPGYKVVDIDTPEDIARAELLFRLIEKE